MFRLYGNIAGWKLLDLGAEEFDMMATMEEYLQNDENICFLLIKTNEYGDEPYKSVHGREEYVKYLDDFYKRTMKDKKIMELRKEMMDIVYEEPKTKVKRRLPKK